MYFRENNKTNSNVFGVILIVTFMCLANSVFAQPLPDTSKPARTTSEPAIDAALSLSPPVNWKIEDVQALRKQISESQTLPVETKNSILDTYDKAIAQLKLIEQYLTQKTTYLKSRQEVPQELEKLQQQLIEMVSDQPVIIPPNLTVPEMEQKVAAAKKVFEEIGKQVVLLESEPKRRLDRKSKIPEEMASAKEQLNVVKQKLAGFQDDPAAPELSRAKKNILEIQQQMYQANVDSLEEEQQYYDIAGPLLTVQRDLAARKLTHSEKMLKFWDKALNEKRRIQANEIKKEAEQAVEKAQYAHPVIKKLAEENAVLAKLQNEVISEMESSNRYGQEVANQLNAIEADFKEVRGRLQVAEKITNVMGMLLLSKRGDLPDIHQNIEKIKAREGKAALAQLMWSDYDKKWLKLADTETQAKKLLIESGLVESDPEYEEVLKQTAGMLQGQRKIVRKISDDHLDFSEALAKNDLTERKFVKTTRDYARFIDQNILWVRSSTVLKPCQLNDVFPAFSWLISPANWKNLARIFWNEVIGNLILHVVFGAVIAGLVLMRKRTVNTITSLTIRSDHKYSDSFKHTIETLFLTILSSLPLSAIFLFVAWRLQNTAVNDDFSQAVSKGLWAAGIAIAVYIFLLNFCFPKRLGTQLGYSDSVLNALKGHFVWFFLLIIPVVFLVEFYQYQQTNTNWHNTVGRLCFMIEQVIVAVFMIIVFSPNGKVIGDHIKKMKTGWLNRFRYFWYGACIVVPISFLVIAEMGYYYAAQNLHIKLVWTILLIGLAVLVNAMLRRWFKVVKEKLEISQKRKQLLAEHKKDTTGKESETESVGVISSGVTEKSYKILSDSIDRQARRLIRLVNTLVVVIGFWCIWRNVMPALGILEHIEIWTTTDAKGNPLVIDASCLAMAFLFIVLTIITARNLPGLLQVVVLQRLPFDSGVSFAVTAISRYIIVVIGIILTFNRVGFGWSKAQWLIAAMSVGLGFGLQEIFANFVSGLIILFEQPIRVGDMVTIGDVNGRVTQIRIRATTLRKYDQKELVVPNKEFVTGRLINWTLSDKTLRMDFLVGVAYGSDIKKTEQTLYAIAAGNPLVIQKDPAPVVLFRSFENSSLEFQLRLFVPNMDNYLKVWHEINCAIDTEFRKENIEIAFPQRDLHLRSTDIPFHPMNVRN